jgi:hypothetical protein
MLKNFALFSLFVAASAAPAFAGVVVNNPGNNSIVISPFNLSAYASTCSSQSIASMGYSLDSSTSTTIVHSASINASVSTAAGGHTLHVKAWGNAGAVCVTDVAVTVSSVSIVPAIASIVSNIQTLGNWIDVHDTGTPGTSSGTVSITSSPSLSGAARRLSTVYTDYGGERSSVGFGDDEAASNFLFDVWVNLASPSYDIANLEFDLNQVMSNGQTVIFGFQCDAWSGTWDYAANGGTPTSPWDHWVHTSAPCNAHTWGTNQWHHVQISYSRDNSGYINYKSVWLDGRQSNINASVLGAYALGWSPTLLVNVEIDGYTSGSGSSTVFVDDLTVYRW